MTFEALLTFIGILVAILAIVRPVQRRSINLFVPLWSLGLAMTLALILIVVRDAPLGVPPPFGWPLPLVLFSLTLAAFLIPVGAALWCWNSWQKAKLTGAKFERVESIFQAALREGEFDEVERIIRSNFDKLDKLPDGAVSVLFDPAMVSALIGSHSFVHLELLANVKFLKSLKNRFGHVDVVTRELLRSESTPLRSAVVSRYGGWEELPFSDSERCLIEKTFQNPEWYAESSAHYPLVISSVEILRTGKLDTAYNNIGRDYEALQGISRRARCPIYLALKTEVIAIESAIRAHNESDFYVSDLSDIFFAVQERSKFSKESWESDLSNREFPTPYAYLLYEISADLNDLSETAVQAATSPSMPYVVEPPGSVANALARIWSLCVWNIADSQGQVSLSFRNEIIKRYLLFVLALGWEPSEIYHGSSGHNLEELKVWRDLFLRELQERFAGDSRGRAVIMEAMESLDQGKRFVFEGYDWLEQKLFGKSD
jgi:hypothetical protein